MTQPEQGATLEVDRLRLCVGKRLPVGNVSFEACAGEVTAIIGPNGAGKTSLLEGMLGLRPSDQGEVRWAGMPIKSFAERARIFAYLPDQSALPSEVSVCTLVEHALRHATGNIPVGELRRLLSIDSLLNLGAGVLSHGERQRVQLFCTLALGRRVVVLDEPFSAFDPLQLRAVYSALGLVTESGSAIVASIHQLADAERIADRVLLLAEGATLTFGTPRELKAAAGEGTASLEDAFVALLERRSRAA